MTEYIVHIGDGKCGTTSLQTALYRAKADLAQAGITYSSVARNHSSLITLLGKSHRGDDQRLHAQADELINSMKEDLQHNDTALLSSEYFFNFTPDELREILSAISTPIQRLDIVAYLRPPHEMYLSWVQQNLKGASTLKTPEMFMRRVNVGLARWVEDEGKDSLTVRLFDKSRLVGSDITSDFSELLNTIRPSFEIDLQSVRLNASLTAEQTSVLQILRKTKLQHLDGKGHPLSIELVKFFTLLNRHGKVGHKAALSEPALGAVCSLNRPVVNALNEMFPDLGMEMPEISWDETQGAPWRDTDDVTTILTQCSPILVDHLSRLVPPLSPELEEGLGPQQRAAMDYICETFNCPVAHLRACTSAYWTKCGCVAAADALVRI